MKNKAGRPGREQMVVRDTARWWVKGDGVAYTTAQELTSSRAFWRHVAAAKLFRLHNVHIHAPAF